MRFEVLGPMRVTDQGGTRPVAGVRQRIVLGALLAHANQPLRAEQLAETVWDGAPSDRAVPTLRTYIARLRSDLGPRVAARIVTRDGGYLAEVGPGELDAQVFEALCADTGSAIRVADWAGACDHAARALALWRGMPLGDVPSQALRDSWLPHLDRQRVQVTEWHIEAQLHLGGHEHLVPRLRQLTASHPLHERFHAQLMRALSRCGRRAEALAVYQDARKVLVEELGTEPGSELRNLHDRILADDDDPLPPRARADLTPGGPAVSTAPRHLPAAAGHFTGRRGEMNLITEPYGPLKQTGIPGGTVVISAIDGMAGIGKTALAVHAAHRLADRFPDGQLFIDLHGHTNGYPPRDPGQALEVLLRALDVPARRIPEDTDARAALYRQRLAGTRTLILLDNALDEAQVRPLLPGTPGSLVLITSRRRLKGLHDAHTVALDVLPEADALTLLRTVIASAPSPAEDPALAEIVRLCGRLPLALRIAGALLRHRPAWTPRYLAGLLRDEHRRLAVLADGDHDLRAVFDLSYTGLGERERLLFRRLALVPGPESDAFAAAALLDVGPRAASRLLEDLVDHNLLIEHAPGRYRLHDLIRVHARTLADSDPRPDRDGAMDRLLHYYEYTAQSASSLIARYPRAAPANPPPAHLPALTDPETARAWLRAERENLEAAHDHARGLALGDRAVVLGMHAGALAAGLAEILRTDGPLDRALDLHQAAADTAERHGRHAAWAIALTDLASARLLTGDLPGAADTATQVLGICRTAGNRLGEAGALTELARVRFFSGDLPGAAEAGTQALEICQSIGNRLGEAGALTELARVWLETGNYADAADASTRSLEIYRSIGRRLGEADSLVDLGRVWLVTGDLAAARETLSQALEICRETGHRNGEAGALIELSRVWLETGNYPAAAESATQVLRIYEVTGNRHGEAIALAELGRVRRTAGDLPAARDALSGALEIFRTIGSRNGEGWVLNHYAAAVAAIGDLPHALALYQRSLAMNRELNKPDDEAIALEGLGECHLTTGQAETGTACLNQALEIYERLGMTPDIERLRTRLASLTTA